jgi:hypothetical protein
MEVPERATDSGTVTTMQEAGHEGADYSPIASEGRRMKYRTLDWTGIEGGDVSLGDERRTGL